MPFTGPKGFPTEFQSGARRLDAGGKLNPVSMAAVKQALTLTLHWRPAAIQAQLRELTDCLADKLIRYLGARVSIVPSSQRCGHILGVRLGVGILPAEEEEDEEGVGGRRSRRQEFLHEVLEALKRHGVVVSLRGGCLRLSPYVFNTLVQMNRTAALLAQLLTVPQSHRPLQLPAALPLPLETARPPQEEEEKEEEASGRPMRVIVTGVNGWLGQLLWESLLARAAMDDLDLYAAHHDAEGPSWVAEGRRIRWNIAGDQQLLRDVLREVRPHALFHLAAISSPAVCHKDATAAFAVNCPLALTQALQAECPQCVLVFASTDMVYDGNAAGEGEQSRYSPYDAAYPVNIYGASKLRFESPVLALKRGFVLRLSNMVGPPCVFQKPPGGPKFLQFLHEAFLKKQFIGLKTDEKRSFVYVGDVLQIFSAILTRYDPRRNQASASPSIRAEGAGVGAGVGAGAGQLTATRRLLNVGGPRSLSRLDLAAMLCEELGGEIVVYRMKDFKVKLDTGRSSEAVTGTSTAVAAAVGKTQLVWEVFSMTSDEGAGPAAKGGGGGGGMAELQSLKDITMDSSATEELFKMEFRELRPLLRSCLNVP